jgi:Protein of unknown function (DUF3306)
MTAPETSLSRWSRLKRETVSKGQAGADQGDLRARSAGPANSEPEAGLDEKLVDPEDLPPIDAITVDTDIRAFLKSRVPDELTRAALRRAWVSDPAIRDFIGIAENQWDFNDPTAIPGFGPLHGADDISALLGRALGQSAELAGAIAELPMAVEPQARAEIVRDIGTSDLPEVPGASNGIAAERVEIEHRGAEEESGAPPERRPHGGALPRKGVTDWPQYRAQTRAE